MYEGKRFDVEHALSIFAYSYYFLHAESIYDDTVIEELGEGVRNCHIYVVGFVPVVTLIDMRQDDQTLVCTIKALGSVHDLEQQLPNGWNLHKKDSAWYIIDKKGHVRKPPSEFFLQLLHKNSDGNRFEVKYVGQAFGTQGSRNSLDRLKKHETLQKIALRGVPNEYTLAVLLLEIQPSNQIFTLLNPNAETKSEGKERLALGQKKLYGTSEHERITLYEASLIRYFKPQYNKEFKNSFPSTNMKVLRDCYAKDFSAIIAEICFEDMPFYLCSETISPSGFHIVNINLQTSEDRQVFFSH